MFWRVNCDTETYITSILSVVCCIYVFFLLIVLDHVWKRFHFKYMVILEAAVSHAVELYVCILAGVSINLSTQFKSARKKTETAICITRI